MKFSKKSNINFGDKIFIAGASGLVGSSLKKLFLNKGYGKIEKGGKILTPNRKELDLANYLKVESWFKENKPDVVVVAAAKVGGIIANSNEPFNFLFCMRRAALSNITSCLLNSFVKIIQVSNPCAIF